MSGKYFLPADVKVESYHSNRRYTLLSHLNNFLILFSESYHSPYVSDYSQTLRSLLLNGEQRALAIQSNFVFNAYRTKCRANRCLELIKKETVRKPDHRLGVVVL